jgi:hemolysin activation/secretion protein
MSASYPAPADRAVVPVLKAGPEPGTVDLDLNVDDRLPIHISAELNNQYSADTKPLRASLTVDYANVFGRLDDFSAQYQESPQRPRDVGVLAVNYTHRLADGEHLAFSYLDSTSNVATLGALDVLGKGHMFGLHFDDAFIARPGMLQSFTLGFDYKRFDQTVNAGLGATVPTPIAYGLATIGYLGTVIGTERIWTWSSTAEVILRGVGSDPQDFANKCFECRQNAIVLRADGSVSQQLGAGFTVLFKAASQLAADPLVSNEQFVIGGAQTVRGYFEAEELGDLGYRGSLEIHAPSVFGSSALQLRPFTFSDWGRVRFLAPLPGQSEAVRLASYGAGFDLAWKRYLTGNLIWSHAFDAGSATLGGSSRWLFVVKGSW